MPTQGNPPSALTFNSVSYDSLGQVGDSSPGVSVVSAADVAESGHILSSHQLIGLGGVAQNSDEKQEESACELIVHRARVHGPVTCEESSAQDAHVLPLEQQKKEEGRGLERKIVVQRNETHIKQSSRATGSPNSKNTSFLIYLYSRKIFLVH